MPPIHPHPLPEAALLRLYHDGPGYADCYRAELPVPISLEAFVESFYTSPLFKIERTLLHWLAAHPANDGDANRLAGGESDRFSIWRVEARSSNQLLLSEKLFKRTRSWLMTEPLPEGGTSLYFGSAVIPKKISRSGAPHMGLDFHLLGGFHRLYSRLLLDAARKQLLDAHGLSP